MFAALNIQIVFFSTIGNYWLCALGVIVAAMLFVLLINLGEHSDGS